jgi:transcriptional regulator with XRE-family HTH domain
MIHHRRIVSSGLSSDIIGFLMQRGHTQAQIAKLLGVSAPFVSLVKSRDRSLTLDHVERLQDRIGLPLGEFFIALAEWRDGARLKPNDPFVKDMRQSDRARASIQRAIAKTRRKAG